MTTLLPFIRVPDVGFAKSWYESIGFTCIGTHEEPGCGLDWAMMCRDDAVFMLYAQLENTVTNANNCGLYFKMDTIEGLREKLEGKARIIEIVDETAYGRKEITFHDCYGFQVTFSSEPD
ncbi:MAG: VOC family protein [Chitinophagaceae bacterium]|nr:VOC family protein [Chitinophagaceae bacterium]MCW5929053.1 VOC family protein [Chitinophagaceae bacterium]